MKSHLIYILFVTLSGIFIAGCSELETNVTQPQKVSVHKTGIITPGHANFHGKLIRENGWTMKNCEECHGANFSGGIAKASCLNCHTGTQGPASCNTCHGSFADPSRIAPPRDLNGNTSNTLLGVGAHSKHLYENTLGNKVSCGSCHNVPSSLYADGHLDTDGRAEVILKAFAVAHGATNAVYNSADGSCANTYCHGNFTFYKDSADAKNKFAYTGDKMTGTPKTVKWTQTGGDELQCGSCHGLPPVGHIQVPLSSCYTCHGEVVDEKGNIIDKTKHMNGVINARGN